MSTGESFTLKRKEEVAISALLATYVSRERLEPLMVVPWLTTVFPTRSSPSVMGGVSVIVTFDTEERFMARAKSSALMVK